MALGPQVYKMVLDSRNFVDGVVLTRRELQLQRSVLDQVRPSIENYGDTLDQMAELVRKNALTVEEYNAANRALRAEFPENAAAAELVNAVMAEGEAVRRQVMTADDALLEAERRHTDALAANEQLFRDNAQTAEQYREKIEQLLAVSPDVLEAERARSEALRHGQEIARSVMTEEERFLEARQRADAAMEAGGLEAEAYARHLKNLESQLPENAAKEEALREAEQRRQEQLREGAAIVDRNRTVEERLADERQRATELLAAKALTEGEYERELRRINSLLPDVVAAERQREAAIARGAALNEQYTPTIIRARRELQEVHEAYAAGRMTAESYRNAQFQLGATIATGIPGMGQLAGVAGDAAGAMAALGPAGVIGAAAFVAITGGAKLTSEAVSYAAEQVSRQIERIDQLSDTAQKIGVTANEYERLAYAASLADIEQATLTSGLEKALSATSKAADGNAKLGRVFEMLGLDARQLRSANAPELLEEITLGLDRIPNSADRVRAATAIFGSADFLRFDTENIGEAVRLLDGLGANIDERAAGRLDDAVKELNVSLEVTWGKLAQAVTPALADAAEAAADFIVELNKNDGFQNALDNVDASARLAAAAMRVAKDDAGKLSQAVDSVPTLGIDFTKMLPGGEILSGLLGGAKSLTQEFTGAVELVKSLDSITGNIPTIGDSPRRGEDSAVDDTDTTSVDKLTEQLEQQAATMRDAVEYAGLTKEEIALLKLAEEGASQATRDAAAATASQIAEYERQAKAIEELGRQENEVAEATKQASDVAIEAEAKREKAVRQLIDPLQSQLNTLGLTEEQILANKLAIAGATAEETAMALAIRGEVSALDAQQDAAKKAAAGIADLEKQIRQAGMTADEKKLDDLAIAGVSDQDLAKIDHLQKELALREAIQKQAEATSFTVARGSKEEADAMAQAIKAAQMRLELARAGVIAPQVRGGSIPLSLPPGIGPQIGGGGQLPTTVAGLPASPLAVDNAIRAAALGGVTATASPAPPIVVAMGGSVLGSADPSPVASVPRQVAPVQQVVPKAMEQQLAEQRRANALLERIAEKNLTVEVEEVTL